jgi:hypothetical protein
MPLSLPRQGTRVTPGQPSEPSVERELKRSVLLLTNCQTMSHYFSRVQTRASAHSRFHQAGSSPKKRKPRLIAHYTRVVNTPHLSRV